MGISTKRGDFKKYSVGTVSGSGFAFTDTLTEAKLAGKRIAAKQAWRGRFNLAFLTLSISKQSYPGSAFYKGTGWQMYIPVRGSGMSAEAIIRDIKNTKKANPMTWVRKRR